MKEGAGWGLLLLGGYYGGATSKEVGSWNLFFVNFRGGVKKGER